MAHDHITSTFWGIRHRLEALAERITGNSDDAADAVQDAFCRLWERRQSIEQAAVEGVTVVTVRNLSIDAVRRRSAHREQSLDDNVTAMAISGDDRRVGIEETYAQVKAIIDHELSPLQRQVVTLRELEGLEFDEIARRLHMQPTHVRVQLSRARKLIREIYRRKNNEQ